MEIWKDIPGYEGIYQASNFGRIRSTPGKITSSKRFVSGAIARGRTVRDLSGNRYSAIPF